jgi:hypothetical protein
MKSPLARLGRLIGTYLSQPSRSYQPANTCRPELLQQTLRPGDVLLVDGNTRLSVAIKYLTQSTWSHAALYVGAVSRGAISEPHALIEADLVEGVRAVPVGHYVHSHTRICRPVGLSPQHLQQIIAGAVVRIGHTYDLKNVMDLGRYLLPTPPVPVNWRRRMIALGSGEPTRAICSTLIAQLFQSVGYPILPEIESRAAPVPGCDDCTEEILHIRHHSLFAPRDFDISPYFRVIKPTVECDFDYQRLNWNDRPGKMQ